MIERHRGVQFTSDEALSLLDILLTTSYEMSGAQQSALEKLADYCRRVMRDEERPLARSAALCGVSSPRSA